MNPAANSIRTKIATVITRHFPGALIHLAKAGAKKARKIKVTSYCIDIIDTENNRVIRLNRSNAVYVVDMLNHFDYYFDSAEPILICTGKSAYRCVDFSTPRYQHVKGFDDFPLMCPSLTEPFVTTRQYLDFARLMPNQVVLDLGCYSALTSIAFSKEVGAGGKVIALEPDPGNFSACKINIANHERINRISNIELMPAAVDAGRGVMQFSAEGAMGSAAAAVVGSYRGKVIEVQTYGLLDIAELHNLRSVSFIKMDVEGAEEKVLGASEAFFSRFRPKIIIEPHMVGGVLSQNSVMEILRGFDYRCSVLEQEGVSLELITACPN